VAPAAGGGQTPGVERIGPYEVVAELGRGGMGAVYRARDGRTGREVALKLLLAGRGAGERARRRTGTELRTLTRLRHPHVVPALDAGEHAGAPYLALGLVVGETLEARLRRGPLGVEAAVRLGRELAGALEHVHGQGVLHRDLKPDNVLLRAADGAALLTDFGLALDLEASRSRVSKTGVFLGTPGYWPPEQARGELEGLGPAADVYGLGAVLYAALTGRPPVEGEAVVEYLEAVRFRRVPAVRSVRPEVPAWLSEVCRRCLEPAPEDRYGSAAEVGRALAAGAAGTRAKPGRGLAGRRAGPPARVAALVAGAAVGAGALAWGVATDRAFPPDRTPPRLVVEAPAPGSRLAGAGAVVVRGRVEDASATRVRVAGGPEARIPAGGGAFGLEVAAADGPNALEVTAVDAAGNASEPATVRFDYARWPAWYAARPEDRRAPWPLPEGLALGAEPGEYVNARDGSVLVWIPPGSFRMGSEQGKDDERPVHRVTFARGYFLGKHEVTWAQYRRFCRATGREAPSPVLDLRQSGGGVHEAGPEHPVFRVSWEAARAYCGWAGLRLPSEAEWEYGARGPEGSPFPWGDAAPDGTRLNLADRSAAWDWPEEQKRRFGLEKAPWSDGAPATAPVGSYPAGASAFGCLDMAGNVWEWVEDGYHGSYRGAPSDGSAWTNAGASLRVLRGGGWRYPAWSCRSARRDWNVPGNRLDNLGFRPARSLP